MGGVLPKPLSNCRMPYLELLKIWWNFDVEIELSKPCNGSSTVISDAPESDKISKNTDMILALIAINRCWDEFPKRARQCSNNATTKLIKEKIFMVKQSQLFLVSNKIILGLYLSLFFFFLLNSRPHKLWGCISILRPKSCISQLILLQKLI